MSRDIVVRFGRRLQGLRKTRNMNQTILADKIGTDQATISRIENGKQETCLRFIELLAMGLKVPLSEMFKDL
ncbi:MAG: helix-turn-helix domain-containing protein [Acidobacteriia bacterium]|nr:helix-turn-helix domain-containing protein [Terriglobia bacterium]